MDILTAPAGWRLHCYAELPSTSDFCIEQARAGEPGGLAVLALHQTQGRGSRGRVWSDPGDSLALSVLIRPEGALRSAGTAWGFLASLAFYDALADGRSSPRLRLKWPNDILLDGRKLAGLLVETDGLPADHVVIGFGANLSRAPEIPGRKLACLAEWQADCAPQVIADRILARLTQWLSVFEREGFAPIRDAWLTRSLPSGSPLVVSDGKTYSEGRFVSIGENGELLLERDGTLRRIMTGEIFYGEFPVNSGKTGRAARR